MVSGSTVTNAAVASRVVSSAACQAGPSGRGAITPRRHRHHHRQHHSQQLAMPASSRSARAGGGMGGGGVVSWNRLPAAGGSSTRGGGSRGRGGFSSATASAISGRALALVVCATCGFGSGRGSQQPAMSTLVPEAETVAGVSADAATAHVEEDAAVAVARRTLPSGLEVLVAQEMPEFEVAAELRATAFYEDLEERQALPFPPRFVATFRREFAQRERRALKERTAQPSGPSRRCLCLMSRLPDLGLVGCLDVSVRTGPCASQVNGVCVSEGERYVYIDNVAVDSAARRRGSASAMLQASSDIAMAWAAGFIYTHVHADNVAARRLYHAYGFRAPKGVSIAEAMAPGKAAQWASPRLSGLVLLRAPLPLMQAVSQKAAAAVGDCTCGATFEDCDECICRPA